MPKLIKADDAASGDFACYQRGALEQSIMASAHEIPMVDPHEERDAILAEARALAEERVREAYAEGLRRGETAGRPKFDASLAECVQALNSAVAAIRESNDEFLLSLEPQVVKLAHAIAGHVVQREATGDSELIVRTVRRALESLVERRRLVLRLHPQDLEAIRSHKVTLLDEFDGVDGVELIPDEHITPGGCIAESETLHADARLEVQLKRALEALME